MNCSNIEGLKFNTSPAELIWIWIESRNWRLMKARAEKSSVHSSTATTNTAILLKGGRATIFDNVIQPF